MKSPQQKLASGERGLEYGSQTDQVTHACRNLTVILDGGIRRGVHVLKALARGAKACSIARSVGRISMG
jgi:hypothetical protein